MKNNEEAKLQMLGWGRLYWEHFLLKRLALNGL